MEGDGCLTLAVGSLGKRKTRALGIESLNSESESLFFFFSFFTLLLVSLGCPLDVHSVAGLDVHSVVDSLKIAVRNVLRFSLFISEKPLLVWMSIWMGVWMGRFCSWFVSGLSGD